MRLAHTRPPVLFHLEALTPQTNLVRVNLHLAELLTTPHDAGVTDLLCVRARAANLPKGTQEQLKKKGQGRRNYNEKGV